ncbi:MAG: PDZ domain-containing protein [Actinobacteria bacterium]|nr:PDZ domain-containing protein [Actinomycetota bacterium]
MTAPPELQDPRWQDVPSHLRPSRKIPVWPFIVGIFLLLIGGGFYVAAQTPVEFYALSPGPVNDVGDYIEVIDDTGPSAGQLYFLTVSLREISLLEYWGAKLDPKVDLSPRENIRPTGVSPESLRQQNIDLMEQSKQAAIYVALTRLGYEVTFEGEGSLIADVIQGSAADGVIQRGDVIVAVNGNPVEFSTDAVEYIGGNAPGDVINLELLRGADGPNPERVNLDITLGPYRAEDADGNLIEDNERGMVGVLLSNYNPSIVFPIDINIDSQNIGGPSAGMMFTLEIMDRLLPEDLTAGKSIAGTGTIDQDGNVGAIGGIRQKVFGAIAAGAEIVLVPADNYDDAVAAAGDDIIVVRIETIDDAINYLESLAS